MSVLLHSATKIIANYAIKNPGVILQLYGNGMVVIQPANTWLLKEQSTLPKSIVLTKGMNIFSLTSA